MAYAIPLWPQPALPIAGSDDTFPVRRIFCVAQRNEGPKRPTALDLDLHLQWCSSGFTLSSSSVLTWACLSTSSSSGAPGREPGASVDAC